MTADGSEQRPIDWDKVRLDYSEFHPLDHNILECFIHKWGCKEHPGGYPGGLRRHASFRWEFQTRPWLRSKTWCRIGRHQLSEATAYPEGRHPKPILYTVDVCHACGKEISERRYPSGE